jgi:hypothetical protein
MGLSSLYVFVGISVGILLATLCQSQQQVVLTTFFINGAIVWGDRTHRNHATLFSVPLLVQSIASLDCVVRLRR